MMFLVNLLAAFFIYIFFTLIFFVIDIFLKFC